MYNLINILDCCASVLENTAIVSLQCRIITVSRHVVFAVDKLMPARHVSLLDNSNITNVFGMSLYTWGLTCNLVFRVE